MFRMIVASAIGIGASFLTNPSFAQCTEDPRVMQLGTADEPESVRLKSFLCYVGDRQQNLRLKLEFHRLSEVAASMMVAARSNSQRKKLLDRRWLLRMKYIEPIAIY